MLRATSACTGVLVSADEAHRCPCRERAGALAFTATHLKNAALLGRPERRPLQMGVVPKRSLEEREFLGLLDGEPRAAEVLPQHRLEFVVRGRLVEEDRVIGECCVA